MRHNKITKQNTEAETEHNSQQYSYETNETKPKITHVSHVTIATSLTIGAIGTALTAIGGIAGMLVIILCGVLLIVAGAAVYLVAARNAEANELNSPIPLNEMAKHPTTNLIPDPELRDDVRQIKEHVENLQRSKKAKDEAVISEPPLVEKELHVNPNNALVLSDGRLLVSVTPEYLTCLGESDELTKLQIERIWDSFDGNWIMFDGNLWDAESIWPDRLFVTIERAEKNTYAVFTDPLQIEAVHALKKREPVRVVCKIERRTATSGVGFTDCEILK